jgi:hypothetical protein
MRTDILSFKVPVDEQIKLLMQLCNASTDGQIKVKCIGTLDHLAQYPQSIDANRVSNFTLQLHILRQAIHVLTSIHDR